MKKFLFLNQGQTLIEYALVLSFFAAVFTVSIPPLRIATVDAINRITDQLNQNLLDVFPEWPGDESGGGSGGGTGGGTLEPWLPPELSLLDNNVIYSADNIVLQGSSKIFGNVVTNGTVITSGSSSVTGTIFDNANYNWNFPFPVYPEIPTDSFIAKGDYKLKGGGPVETISENGYYNKFEILNNRELVFNTGNEGDVLTILVDDFNVTQGKIRVEGDGKLILKVNNSFNFGGGSEFNRSGLPENVMMYYSGQDSLEFFGNTKFNGSIYAESAGARFGGSTNIKGNIFLAGEQVNVSDGGAANLSDALLYAPNANLKLVGSASIEGRIIANSITGIGNARITFKPVELEDDFFWDILNPE
ncbi:MAG TPA: hypothetical protein PK581_00070 [Caldisericia bacterium]|nr:hypothetical protein [Caldisericia bacterium]